MHAWLLPLKVFFLFVLLAISILLVLRHKAMEQHYKGTIARIEFAVIIGTAAVLFFPFMSQAFVQSSEALFGLTGRGTFGRMMPVLSLAFGAWTLLMVLFFSADGTRNSKLSAKWEALSPARSRFSSTVSS